MSRRNLNCTDPATTLGAEMLLATMCIVPPGNYAMKSCDVHPFGYLTRPILEEHLLTVLEQAKSYIRSQCRVGNDRNVSVLSAMGNTSFRTGTDRDKSAGVLDICED
jgi:hypothetical protein